MKIGQGGILEEDDGTQVLVNGKPINLQELINPMIDSRFKSEKTAKEKLEARIADLQKQVTEAPSQEVVSQLNARIEELQTQMETAEQTAARKRTQDLEAANANLKKAEENAKTWEAKWRGQKLEAEVSAIAAEFKFIKPKYLMNELEKCVQWEEEKDATTGKGTGVFSYKFDMEIPDEAGKPVRKLADLKEAAAAVAKAEPSFIAGTQMGGSGAQHGFSGGGSGSDKPTGLSSIYSKM